MRGRIAAALLLLAAAAWPSSAAPGPGDFEFQRLNRTYRDTPVAVAPVEWGLLRVRLSTPRHDLALLRHRLRLSPLADGTHGADLWVQFQGGGQLFADVSALGLATRLHDDVSLPRQEKRLQGRVRIARSRDGYRVTTVALPQRAEVQLKSRLGGELLGWCQGLASVPFTGLRCEGLDRALSVAGFPLPAAGQTYLLAFADLTADEARQLDEYLGAR